MTEIIRTPTKATGGITEAEKIEFKKCVDVWTAHAFQTKDASEETISFWIKKLYEVAGLQEPIVVLAQSPISMCFAFGASAAVWYQSTQEKKKRPAKILGYDANSNSVYAQTRRIIDRATEGADVKAAFKGIATDSVPGATVQAEAMRACFDVAGKFGIMCANEWNRLYQGGNMWAYYECYLSSFRDVLKLDLPEFKNYAVWEQCAIHGGFRVIHEKFCIVSNFPEIIKIDDQNRPHCADGPSHRWRDGWSFHYWHGVRIPKEWVEDKNFLTPAIALGQTNAELRRSAIEIIGWDKILELLNAKVIDKDGDPEIGELLEVVHESLGSTKEKFLRVKCGTGRHFALPVPSEMQTALEAQAWTWGLSADEFSKPEVRT